MALRNKLAMSDKLRVQMCVCVHVTSDRQIGRQMCAPLRKLHVVRTLPHATSEPVTHPRRTAIVTQKSHTLDKKLQATRVKPCKIHTKSHTKSHTGRR